MKIGIAILLSLFMTLSVFAKTKKGKNVVIKYKKYESFDLGNLEIEGKIIAPGDLSVKERSRRTFSRALFEREQFDAEVRKDIQNLR
ncbi:MAG: hypothetical protein CME63_16895 [Halobacteriovoraceae bacterium]|jgi:hypothetical protein|nr:hypothetical protein [Halobacteriovoraceae bacterium]MBC99423.1 hypothetical protein [Halobacteriovoraceae bacterium]|tara:strand:- start:58704 stop:58964 length:261 start_codon:yes stop_codon:yes gene_type:complete